MNICEHLTATARILPDQAAVLFEGQEFTYRQFDTLSLAAAERLTAAGIRPGDRVAIMLPNVPAFVTWYYGALRIGAIVVSISTRSAPAEVAFVVEDCSAQVVVSDAPTLAAIADSLPDTVETITTDATASALTDATTANHRDEAATIHNAEPDDPALILYTSGTTGFPKGATLSHMNVRSNVNAFNHLCHMQSTDRMLLAVPLFHCFGQNALLNSAFNVGATLILQHRFDLTDTQRLIREQHITQLYGVPMMFQLLLDSCEPADLPAVDYCFSAAAPLPRQVADRWQAKFQLPINEGYGLTETSPFASYNHRIRFRPGSIGSPIDCVEMKIIDPETGADSPVGTLGEIAIKGPNVMLGYWNRPQETAAAIQDGWFRSGDIGRVDEDGFYYIVDRVKDMIAVGGLKVFPAEVERVLLDHPGVSDVAVVGTPDDVFGEQVVGFVVLTDDAHSHDDVVTELLQYAKQHLASYKVPRQVICVDELPRNPSGKVLKTELRNRDLTTMNATTSPTGSSDSIANSKGGELRGQLLNTHPAARARVAIEYVQHMIHAVTDSDEPLEADTQLLDAGLDSLMIVEMSHRIQCEFGNRVAVPATLAFDYPRICDLADYLIETLIAEPARDEPLSEQPEEQQELRQHIANMSEAEALEELMKELDS